MALRINLYHEILRTKKQAQYDPLKLAMLSIVVIAIGLVSWYIVELNKRSTAVSAYDTQKVKEFYDPMDDGTIAGRKAVMGALSLYLDFINMFLFMLRLFGDRR